MPNAVHLVFDHECGTCQLLCPLGRVVSLVGGRVICSRCGASLDPGDLSQMLHACRDSLDDLIAAVLVEEGSTQIDTDG